MSTGVPESPDSASMLSADNPPESSTKSSIALWVAIAIIGTAAIIFIIWVLAILRKSHCQPAQPQTPVHEKPKLPARVVSINSRGFWQRVSLSRGTGQGARDVEMGNVSAPTWPRARHEPRDAVVVTVNKVSMDSVRSGSVTSRRVHRPKSLVLSAHKPTSSTSSNASTIVGIGETSPKDFEAHRKVGEPGLSATRAEEMRGSRCKSDLSFACRGSGEAEPKYDAPALPSMPSIAHVNGQRRGSMKDVLRKVIAAQSSAQGRKILKRKIGSPHLAQLHAFNGETKYMPGMKLVSLEVARQKEAERLGDEKNVDAGTGRGNIASPGIPLMTPGHGVPKLSDEEWPLGDA